MDFIREEKVADKKSKRSFSPQQRSCRPWAGSLPPRMDFDATIDSDGNEEEDEDSQGKKKEKVRVRKQEEG
jgi:hypothetical protein